MSENVHKENPDLKSRENFVKLCV